MDDVTTSRRAGQLHRCVRCASAGLALALFALVCWLRPDVAVGLVLLGAVCSTLERVRPVYDQPPAIRRTGWRTDAVHFVVDEVLAAAGLVAALLIGLPVMRAMMPDLVPPAIKSQPVWAVWVEALVLAEVCGYWGHRVTHEIPFLWRFHRVHHSSRQLDWLAPSRRHPLDQIFARSSVALPMLVLGFAVPMLVTHFAIRRFQGLLVHANVGIRLGPLEWIVSTPHFHHWHQAGPGRTRRATHRGLPRPPRGGPPQQSPHPQRPSCGPPVILLLRSITPPRTRRAHRPRARHPHQTLRPRRGLLPRPGRSRRLGRRPRPSHLDRTARPRPVGRRPPNRVARIRTHRAAQPRRRARYRCARPVLGQRQETTLHAVVQADRRGTAGLDAGTPRPAQRPPVPHPPRHTAHPGRDDLPRLQARHHRPARMPVPAHQAPNSPTSSDIPARCHYRNPGPIRP